MKDQELEKLWQENLRDEDFNKVKDELAKLKRLTAANTLQLNPNRFRFVPVFLTTVAILMAIFWKSNQVKVNTDRVAESIEVASNIDYEIYDDYLMEDLL